MTSQIDSRVPGVQIGEQHKNLTQNALILEAALLCFAPSKSSANFMTATAKQGYMHHQAATDDVCCEPYNACLYHGSTIN
jgi:hypothetical protein